MLEAPYRRLLELVQLFHILRHYCFYVSLFNHLYWLTGTAIGALAGRMISFNTTGLDFALTAMFITIFVDQWMKNEDHVPAVIGVVVTMICRIVFGSGSFLIPSMIIILGLLLILQYRQMAGAKGVHHDK